VAKKWPKRRQIGRNELSQKGQNRRNRKNYQWSKTAKVNKILIMTDLIVFICHCIVVYIICKIAKRRGYDSDNTTSGGGGCG